MKKTLSLVLLGVFAGCSFVPRHNSVGVDGYFGHVSDDSLMLGIGKFDAIPKEMNFFKVEYAEDTALFSPSTKICRWSVTCTGGTNIAAAVTSATNLFEAVGLTNKVGEVKWQ